MQSTLTSNQHVAPKRRRIYLMRHGDVAYFGADGQPVADMDLVVLSEKGRAQADAAGRYFSSLGIARFDRVISSSLPRTIETAERVTAAYGQPAQPDAWEALREMRSGHPDAITTDRLSAGLLGMAQTSVAAEERLLGGESVAELQDRIVPALNTLRADPAWDTALLVLHGLVNGALISHALTGGKAHLGRLEQQPGCINVLDVGDQADDWVVRAMNVCPDLSAYQSTRLLTVEHMLYQVLRSRR